MRRHHLRGAEGRRRGQRDELLQQHRHLLQQRLLHLRRRAVIIGHQEPRASDVMAARGVADVRFPLSRLCLWDFGQGLRRQTSAEVKMSRERKRTTGGESNPLYI